MQDMRHQTMSVNAPDLHIHQPASIPRIGRRETTKGDRLKRFWKSFTSGGLAMTAAKDQSQTYFRVPWPMVAAALAILSLVWYAHTARQSAEIQQARTEERLVGRIEALSNLVNAQNNQITSLNANVLAANQKADEANQQAQLAIDYLSSVKVELARKGISIPKEGD